MSGERVDLDDLRTLAVAAQAMAHKRRNDEEDESASDGRRPNQARWIIAPRRDNLVDIVVASSGADVFDRALLVDAAFAVAAQPAVVVALLDRIAALENVAANAINAWRDRVGYTPTSSLAMDEVISQGVVTP